MLAARSGRRSEQITEEQLALFEAELKTRGVNIEDLSKANDSGNGPDDQVEKVARQNGLRGEELRLAREQGARPMLNQLHGYLLTIREQVLPKSEAGQAIAYTLNNWTALTRYCGDGDLAIDNNATERSLRGFATTEARQRWCCAASSLRAN